MTQMFTDPTKPWPQGGIYAFAHDHDWYEFGAQKNKSGTWSSLWACTLCPDVGIGGLVGPVPEGYCFGCGWTQKKNKKTCEECKAPLEATA